MPERDQGHGTTQRNHTEYQAKYNSEGVVEKFHLVETRAKSDCTKSVVSP